MLWFTADLHFGHSKIIEFCDRPWKAAEQMDCGLVKRWNESVKDDDHVYVLGDFSFHNAQKTAEIARVLKGKKTLIYGNHDKHSRTQYLAMGFQDAVEEMVIKIIGRQIRLSHFPYWPEKPELESKHELRNKNKRPPRNGYEFLLCGHVHKLWKTLGRQLNVGCDLWGYAPISLSRVEREIYLMEK